jgi:hypothetical protein
MNNFLDHCDVDKEKGACHVPEDKSEESCVLEWSNEFLKNSN